MLALALCAGCASAPEELDPKDLGKVRERAERYADELRWGRFERAATFVHPDSRDAFRSTLSATGEELRFTAIDVAEVVQGSQPGEAQATLRLSFYRMPSVVEQTALERQRWVYDDDDWYAEPDLALYSGKPGLQVPTRPGSHPDR